MSAKELLKAGWGLADDLLATIAAPPRDRRCLVVEIGEERFAVPHEDVREVVDRPLVSPWLRDPWVIGVFALRGQICTLLDPLGEGRTRRTAVVLAREGRALALGVDGLAGVQTFAGDGWKDFDGGRFEWARRLFAGETRATLWFDVDRMLETLDRMSDKETSP